ncbi:MAG: YndJ family protein [Caldilineaceae bacterium]
MNTNLQFQRWPLTSAAIGFGIWLAYTLSSTGARWNYVTAIECLLLLAILVFTPLALALLSQWQVDAQKEHVELWARWLQPFAALLVVWAFAQPTGALAASLSVPWLLCTALVALSGVKHLVRVGKRLPIHEYTLIAGKLYLPVGAGWLLLSRLGVRPLDFPAVIVLLTAVHFHYTGFALPVITTLTGRFLQRHTSVPPFYPWVAGAVVLAMPIIAVGITGVPWLEMGGVLLLAVGVIGLAALIGLYVLRRLPSKLASVPLLIAMAAMVSAVSLGLLYGIGEWLGWSIMTIPAMVQWHGWLNALGFVACALLGWLAAGAEVQLVD